jgi:dTDP-glucose 4,6-dehydratase
LVVAVVMALAFAPVVTCLTILGLDAIDPSLAESELGWQPRETWETGLQKTICWYQENPAWIARARSGAYREYYAQQYGAEVGAS